MYSGIIKETGKIRAIERKSTNDYACITITSTISDLEQGSSIAVNGVCQTVVSHEEGSFTVEALATTLEKTTIGMLQTGEMVNLEPSLRLQDSMDGHMVQGHVQGLATISDIQSIEENTLIKLELPKQLMEFCVPEGSIALHGVALTIASMDRNTIEVNIIPYTRIHTNIQHWKVGHKINVECDVIGRYVVSLLKHYSQYYSRGLHASKTIEDYLKPDPESVAHAIEHLKQGKMIIVFDSATRENEGDFIVPAENVSASQVTFMARQGCGLVCQTITKECAERLELEPMVKDNTSLHHTAFTVSVDATEGTTTGISAEERALTARLLASSSAAPEDFCRPGHIFPIVADPGGVEVREGHTEAAVELMQLSGLAPSALICEILKEDGSMGRLPDLISLSEHYTMPLISIADILEYKRGRNENA